MVQLVLRVVVEMTIGYVVLLIASVVSLNRRTRFDLIFIDSCGRLLASSFPGCRSSATFLNVFVDQRIR
jgi:hypothetical protein